MDTSLKKVILLVEDEVIIAMVNKKALETYGYTVIMVNTGEKAVDYIDSIGGIDLILMDIDLGKGIDGTQAAAQILSRHELPVVFLSSHTEPEIVEKTEKITSYGYVVKNSSITVLDASIKMAFKLFYANKKTEEKEEKYKFITNSIPDIIYSLNAEGRITTINEQGFEQYGYTEEQLFGKSFVEFVHPDDQSVLINSFVSAQKYQRKKTSGLQFRLIAADGSVVWAELNSNARFDLTGVYLGEEGVLRDITVRKKTESDLHQAKELLQSVLDTIPQTICWKDTSSVFLGCNKNYARMVGLPDTHSVIGKTDYDLPWKETEADSYVAYDKKIMNSDQPVFHIIEPAFNADAKESWLETNKVPLHDTDGKVCGILVTCEDITERIVREKNLEDQNKKHEATIEKEQQFRLLHEHAGFAVSYYDPNGIVISFNHLAAKNLGGIPEDYVGKSIYDLFPPEAANMYFARMKKASQSGGADDYEDWVTLPSGMSCFHSVISRIVNDKKQTLGIQIISQDITEQKKSEQELKEKTMRLQEIFDSSIDATYKRIISTGAYEYLSPNIQKITGYSAEDLKGLKLTDVLTVIHPDDRQIIIERNARASSEKPGIAHSFEYRLLHKEGHYITLHNQYIVKCDENGMALATIGSLRDITKQKLADLEIRTYAARIELTMQAANIAWWEMDIPTGNILFAKRKTDMLGYESKDFSHYTDFMKIVHPDDVAKTMKAMRDHFDGTAVRYEAEYRIRSSDGNYLCFYDMGSISERDAKGNALKVAGIVLDVTERKKLESELEESGQYYKTLFRENNAVMLLIDPELKNIVDANSAACKFYGYTYDKITHMKITEINTLSLEELNEKMQFAMEEKNARFIFNHRLANGEIRQVEVFVGTIRSKGKALLYALVFDISDRIAAEEKIKSLLAEKELTLREVHHRIKNNMNTIQGLLNMQAGGEKDHAVSDALKDAGNRVHSMSLLYERLFLSSNFTELTVSEYLSPLVDDILANFAMGNKIIVKKDIADFILDSRQLQSLGIIVNELLTNIMKYAFTGRGEGLVSIDVKLQGDTVSMSIADNGQGMPAHINYENSTGFGLVLVRGLVDQLDGHVRIERGNGTAIILEFKK